MSDARPDLGAIAALLDARRFDEATRLLRRRLEGDASGACHALLALVCFQRERYAEARSLLDEALARGSADGDWRALRAHADANALAGVHVAIPEPTCFDRARLLAPPHAGAGALPLPAAPIPRAILQRGLDAAGSGTGWLLGRTADLLVQVHGRLCGYRDDVWTNWYRRGQLRAMLTLSYMRDCLNRDNLFGAYPRGALTAFSAPARAPPLGVRGFRTADGSWNNLADPKQGAAGTRFGRNVAREAVRPENGERLLTPNPRAVSLALLTREGPMQEVPFLNLLAAAWIQFEVHDWVSHGENLAPPEVIEIPLAEDDPARIRYRQRSMFVGRTQPDPTRVPHGEPLPVSHVNEVTHWWDASQIYGSDRRTQLRLRAGTGGRLALRRDGLLPRRRGVEAVGFVRNWWVGLAMLHTLFVREHNAVCARLQEKYPHWDDERLFNVARLVNAAVIAKIHTIEWTPAILPQRDAYRALNANWFGLATTLLRRRKHRRTRAVLNIRQPELGGVVGNPADDHGVPYNLTEEFVEVYRLHSMLPETLVLECHDTRTPIACVPLAATRQAGSVRLTRSVAMEDLFHSFGRQHPGRLVLNNYPRFMQTLSVPGNPVLDLGAVDILRARERGVPRYNEFRRRLGLNPVRSLEDLTRDPERLSKLRAVYGDGPRAIEDLDLLVGTLAEDDENPRVRPTGFGFGETLFQIFILNATRRLQADRFYTDCYDERTYTQEGLDWIDDADLKTVILRHYPALGRGGLANVNNAFEPWDAEARLDPGRHPLREWERELGPEPWLGDAHR